LLHLLSTYAAKHFYDVNVNGMALVNNSSNWALTSGIAVMVLNDGRLAFWWWRSMEYVTTDDARIKAEIVSISRDPGRTRGPTKDEGDAVSPGEVIARLDSREARIQLQQAQAELDGARSRSKQAETEVTYHTERHKGELPQAEAALAGHRHNLEDAQALTEKTTADWNRTKSLFERQLISAQELAHADIAMRQAQARLYALREKIKEERRRWNWSDQWQEAPSKSESASAAVRRAEADLADLRRNLS
jgi:multidrug resistance efflux pump